jgi:hypothetical protein
MEMSEWWLRFPSDFEAFDELDKQRIEDLTGCIPLLLEPFLRHPGQNLDSLEPQIWDEDVLGSVGRAVFNFAAEARNDPLFKS